MEDKELLEWAAKAAGFIETVPVSNGWHGFLGLRVSDDEDWYDWNPLDDPGAALALAVKLRIEIHFEEQPGPAGDFEVVEVFHSRDDLKGCCACLMEPLKDKPMAAVCRAIVRAAAQIGKAMP